MGEDTLLSSLSSARAPPLRRVKPPAEAMADKWCVCYELCCACGKAFVRVDFREEGEKEKKTVAVCIPSKTSTIDESRYRKRHELVPFSQGGRSFEDEVERELFVRSRPKVWAFGREGNYCQGGRR